MKKYILLNLILTSLLTYTNQLPFIFYIEGNTGSGKTTLLRALCKKNPHFIGLEEPVEAVQNMEGINALSLMYENQDRWSLTVNLLYCSCHVERLKNIIPQYPNRIIVSDRSLYTGRAFCYADEMSGHLHPLESIVYNRISSIAAASLPKPNGFIYIRTKPEVSFERIRKRQRKEESHIPFDYWHNLHKGHDHMLLDDKTTVGDIPLLILDYNEDEQQNPHATHDAVQKIEAFIATHSKNHT